MVCSPVESINRPLEVSMLGRREYKTPSQPQLLAPLRTPNMQLGKDSIPIDSSYSSPLFTQRMYDTEYDNLAIGRFMEPSGSLSSQEHSLPSLHTTQVAFQNQNSNESLKRDQDDTYGLVTREVDKDQVLEVPNHQPDLFYAPDFTGYHENYKFKPIEDSLKTPIPFKAGIPVIEPICVKTNINNLHESCPPGPVHCQQSQVEFKQVVPYHQQQQFKTAANTGMKDENFDETLADLLKDYIKNGPNKERFLKSTPDACAIDPISDSKSSGIIPSNLNLTSEAPLESCCEPFLEFVAPQQRAPKAVSRSNSRESQALVKSDKSSNNGSSGSSYYNDPLCLNVNPSYSVTEWLQTGFRSGSGQSLSSHFSLTSITRGKKRALSNSPLSIDGIDLNTAIRTSPTSLVAYINGSPSNSLSPAFGGTMNERGGCYGHLSARTSPFTSRSSSSLFRGNGASPLAKYREQDRFMASIQSFETQPVVHPEEANTLQNQSIQTLQTNLNMLDQHAVSNLKQENLSSCMYSRSPPVLKAVKPPPSYHQHMLQERSQKKSSKHLNDNLECENLNETVVPLACKWLDCQHAYTERQQLVKHIETVHVDQKKSDEFTCFWSECPRGHRPFNARYKLLIHMRVHSGEKPNKCTFEGCCKAFSRLENLKIHERSHTGEKPYTCQHPGCTKRFSNSSDRAKHQRTHLDTKPYACQVPGCGKKYTDPSSLRKHGKSHLRENQSKKKLKSNNVEVNSEEPLEASTGQNMGCQGASNQLNQYDVPTSVPIPSTSSSNQEIRAGKRLSPHVYPELPLRGVNTENLTSRNTYLPPLQDKLSGYRQMPAFASQYPLMGSSYQIGQDCVEAQRCGQRQRALNPTPISRSVLPLPNPLPAYNESLAFNEECYNNRDQSFSKTNYSTLYPGKSRQFHQ